MSLLPGARRLLVLLVLPLAAASALGQGLPPPGGGGGTPAAPHYAVTYTVGTWHSSGLNGSTQGTFDGGGYGVQTGGVGLPPGATAENPPGPGTADVEGPITAHFTWVPAGDTSYPPVAIVKEVASASYSHLGGGTGHCATGLGAHGLDPNQYGDSVTDTRYSVKQSPGASFSLPAPVNPTADVAQPGGFGSAAGSCGVSYVATPYEVRLNLSGGLCPTIKELLVGQQLIASVDLGGAPTSSSDTYTWSIAGGSPFTSWAVSTNVANAPYPTLTPYVPTNSPSTACCFRTLDLVMVSCTVHLNLAGASGDINLSEFVSTRGPEVTVHRASIGNVQVAPLTDSSNNTYLYLGPYGAHLPDFDDAQILWGWYYGANPKTPDNYVAAYGGSAGVWNFTQIWSPNRTKIENGISYHYSSNGLTGLDNFYPYSGWPTASWYATGAKHTMSDRPGQALGPPKTQVTMNDTFNDYLLYMPPGLYSSMAPLRKVDWTAAGTANYVSATATWSIANPFSTWNGPDYYPAHPTWTIVLANGGAWVQ